MAARGAAILITPNPQGKFIEGIISGTPKPGIMVEIASPFYQGGKHQLQPFSGGTDGLKRPCMILLEKDDIGFTMDDAYVDGERCKAYIPAEGEELNIRFGNAAGTGDDVPLLGLLIANDGDGKFIPTTGSPASQPFQSLVALTDPVADAMIPAIYTGR